MNINKKSFFQCFFLLFLVHYSSSNLHARTNSLFQHRFFPLSTDESLLCLTNDSGFLTVPELIETIEFYEKNNSFELREQAVAVLTEHSHVDHLKDIIDYQKKCKNDVSPSLCILESYWDEKESALRVLALFYDTKTIIKHGEDYAARRFKVDHLRVFEKAIRKIPPFLRKEISKAKPLHELNQEIENMDGHVKELIKDAFPKDFVKNIWSDETHPLILVPGAGFRSQVVAQVYNGQNLIIFTVKAFDKAKSDKLYRDINLRYLVDFRIPIIVHEIAHTIDNFHFWNGKEVLYFFYRYRKISNDKETIKIINDAKLALWPSKWFEAFEYLWEVNDGRYNGLVQEKLAELVAQYILIPERLKQSSPKGYVWLREDVFKNIEYKGYDSCVIPIVKPLTWWEHAIAKELGR